MNKSRDQLFSWLLAALLLLPGGMAAQRKSLATFEEGSSDLLSVEAGSYTPSLFVSTPAVCDNPDTSGINKSARCLGAINVADADWYGNTVELKLSTPLRINASNRLLSFLAYRSIQPKKMRIGFNGYEETNEVYYDKVQTDGAWERIIVDLGTEHLNDTLRSIWIVFSCNWDDPRTGWGEAAYYFDDFQLLSERLVQSTSVVVFPSVTYQTVKSFGASDCWVADIVGKYWGDAEKEYAAEKLFSQEFDAQGNPLGIGLSNWRVNLGGGTSEQGDQSDIEDVARRTECFLTADSTYDWTKQSGQQFFMERARDYGCESFVFFSNTPPVYFTKNGLGYAKGSHFLSGSNLAEDKYDDFAEFMATVVQHFSDEGYPISYISPVNEPQNSWSDPTQEGSPWQNAEIKKLVVELDKSLQARNSTTRIMIPEASSYKELMENDWRAGRQINAFFNPASSNYVGNLPTVAPLVAGHSYWTYSTNADLKDTRAMLNDSAKLYGLDVFQTEWSMLDTEPSTETGFPESYDKASYMDIALFMAKLIHSDLVFANAASWDYWTALATEVYSQKNRFLLLRVTPGNGNGGYDPYASILNPGKIESTSTLWALGNYSLFIRPGYKRVRIDGVSEMNHVLGSAYLAPDGSRLVAVFVNTGEQARNLNISFQGLEGKAVSVRKYVTSSSKSLQRDQTLAEDGVERMQNLAARSVTTLVYDIGPEDATALSTIEASRPEEPLSLLPNPVRPGEEVTLRLNAAAGERSEYAVEIYGTNASLVYQTRVVSGGNTSFTVPELPSGMYVVRVTCGTEQYRTKLIVE